MSLNVLILCALLIPTGLPQQWLLHLTGYWPDKLRIVATLLATVLLRSRSTAMIPLAVLKSPIVICCFAFFVCGLISALWTPSFPRFFTTFTERGTRVIIPLLVFAAGTRKPKDLWLPLVGFIAVGVFTCCLSFYGGAQHGFTRPAASDSAGTWIFPIAAGIKNSLGQSTASMAAAAFAFALAARKLSHKIGWGALTFFGLAATVVAAAKSNYLGAFLSMFLMIVFRGVRPRTIIGFTLVALVGIVVAVKAAPEELIEDNATTDSGSFAARPYFWGLSLDRIASAPLKPIGWGTFYHPSGMREVEIFNYCNVFLEDWVEGGPWSMIVELLWLWYTFATAFKNARRLDPHSIGAVANSAAAGFIVINLVFGLVDSYWTRVPQMIPAYSGMGIIVFLKIWLDNRDKLRIQQLDAELGT